MFRTLCETYIIGEVSEWVRSNRLPSGQTQRDERRATEGAAGRLLQGRTRRDEIKFNDEVVGDDFGEMSEWFKEHDWNSCIRL